MVHYWIIAKLLRHADRRQVRNHVRHIQRILNGHNQTDRPHKPNQQVQFRCRNHIPNNIHQINERVNIGLDQYGEHEHEKDTLLVEYSDAFGEANAILSRNGLFDLILKQFYLVFFEHIIFFVVPDLPILINVVSYKLLDGFMLQ